MHFEPEEIDPVKENTQVIDDYSSDLDDMESESDKSVTIDKAYLQKLGTYKRGNCLEDNDECTWPHPDSKHANNPFDNNKPPTNTMTKS